MPPGDSPLDLHVKMDEEVEVDAGTGAGNEPRIVRGRIVNDGVLRFKGGRHVTFGPEVTMLNAGLLRFETRGRGRQEGRTLTIVNQGGEIDNDGSLIDGNIDDTEGTVIIRPKSIVNGSIISRRGTVHLVGTTRQNEVGVINGNLEILGNGRLIFPSLGPTNTLTPSIVPVASLFTINGNLSLSSGEAIVNIDYNAPNTEFAIGGIAGGTVYFSSFDDVEMMCPGEISSSS